MAPAQPRKHHNHRTPKTPTQRPTRTTRTAPDPGPPRGAAAGALAAAANHSLDKISMDNFAACFPTVAVRAPGTLEFVQRKMVERLGDLWHKEFERIMADRQVVARLNELEGLIEDAARRKMAAPDPTSPPTAPHTLPAPTVLHAHLAPHLAAQQSQLSAKLADSQAANARLWEEIQAQRAEMEALLGGVEKALRDVDGANALLGRSRRSLPPRRGRPRRM
ncbi:hypothetical protein NEMBOFW57_000825 [Staphylotrichum longicolle]|uniref:Nnf1 n=1 Tax=Staphylotrichum longicolle TaxID=669026 RepID=A0AAD4I185_9PEZI|nr:hypothetical protein NEMBOFW57_000825 [Staphylotrichum longicolle]